MVWIAAIIVVLVLFYLFPKQLGVLFGLIVIGSGAAYLYDEQQDQKREREIEAVAITIAFDTKICTDEFPLLVDITNRSKKTVTNTSWFVGAYRNGYSNNVLEDTYSEYSSDKILSPGQHFAFCYIIPSISGSHIPEELVWSVGRKSINFRYR